MDVLSDLATNVLQVYKISNQVIMLVLLGSLVPHLIYKNIKFNEATKYSHGTNICNFQTMKPLDVADNNLVSTVGDFSLPQSPTYASHY